METKFINATSVNRCVSKSIKDAIRQFTNNSIEMIDQRAGDEDKGFPFMAVVFALDHNDKGESIVASTTTSNLSVAVDADRHEVGAKLRIGVGFLESFAYLIAQGIADHAMEAVGMPKEERTKEGMNGVIGGIMHQLLMKAAQNVDISECE